MTPFIPIFVNIYMESLTRVPQGPCERGQEKSEGEGSPLPPPLRMHKQQTTELGSPTIYFLSFLAIINKLQKQQCKSIPVDPTWVGGTELD